jgi:hypothetical protein
MLIGTPTRVRDKPKKIHKKLGLKCVRDRARPYVCGNEGVRSGAVKGEGERSCLVRAAMPTGGDEGEEAGCLLPRSPPLTSGGV